MTRRIAIAFLLPGILAAFVLGATARAATPHKPFTLQAELNETHYLPPAMYGRWSIVATVLRSNAPVQFYEPKANELWTLSESDGTVTLQNIVTQAAATIQVDNVSGNTATFRHTAEIPSRRWKIIEIPTVTVDGDKLSGINRQQVMIYDHNRHLSATYEVDIRVEGTRLAGARTIFGNPAPKDFDVEPLQFKN